MKNKDQKMLTVMLDKKTFTAFKILCSRKDWKMTVIIRNMIDSLLKKGGTKNEAS